MAEVKQKTTVMEFINKNFLGIVVLIVALMWYTKKNGNGADGRLISSDTTRTTVLQPIVYNQPYTPQQAGSTVYLPVPQQYQSVTPATDVSGLVKQVIELSNSRVELAKEFGAVKQYKDSIPLRDSAGNRVGVVNLDQLVSENTLKKTTSNYQLAFPLTIIKNTMAEKLRNQWFVGFSIGSPVQVPKVETLGIGALIKNKKENIIAITGNYNLQTKLPGVVVGYYPKISFRSVVPKILRP